MNYMSDLFLLIPIENFINKNVQKTFFKYYIKGEKCQMFSKLP